MKPLISRTLIVSNLYKDSVALMRIAHALLQMPGVVNASLQMGTPANKAILQEAGLLDAQTREAGASDVMVVVQADSSEIADAAVVAAQAALSSQAASSSTSGSQTALPTHALNMWLGTQAADNKPLPNVVQISVPGAYAAAEGLKAVARGLHVFMFSDNVPLAQEVALKQAAHRQGVLVMGPDCGTAIINGVSLGFANVVARGAIGIVAASGTGLQEVSTQIHRLGAAARASKPSHGASAQVGVSQAIGTGGRDIYEAVGGITMLQGIALLAQDAMTQVIVVISKPPAPAVATQVLQALQQTGKPAVVLFLGSDLPSPSTQIHMSRTLVDAAAQAVRLLAPRSASHEPSLYPLPLRPRFAATQRYLRALYSGGTYCSEAQTLWRAAGLTVWSNIPLQKEQLLANPKHKSLQHTALDLGDDDFTVGRPHPMIDQSARLERLRLEALDPEVAVIVLDVVIGWGAHADPAAELAPVILEVRAQARRAGRHLAVLGFVCGTEDDPQVLSQQEAKLKNAGMVLAGNSANAAWLAGAWVQSLT